MSQPSDPGIEEVNIKAVAIHRGEAILTVFNRRWGGFSLPMSKTRPWADRRSPGEADEEKPTETATRAAAEALGRPLGPDEIPEPHPDGIHYTFNRSGRDGRPKLYNIELFTLRVGPEEAPRPVDGVATAWMTPGEMVTLRPVTTTASEIARKLMDAGNR